MAGFAWFLIVVTVVVAALAVLTALYLLVHYMHPEDKNQAWFPKIVVIMGITLAIWTVLLFPLDAGQSISHLPLNRYWKPIISLDHTV
jgi:LMBR1 domain-containing protein 1